MVPRKTPLRLFQTLIRDSLNQSLLEIVLCVCIYEVQDREQLTAYLIRVSLQWFQIGGALTAVYDDNGVLQSR